MWRSFLHWIALMPALAVSSLSEAQDPQLGSVATPQFAVTARRADTSIRVVQAGDTVVFDISGAGIDKTIIQRLAAQWPKAVQVRLHFAGLESFKAGNGSVAVEWSVSSSGDLPVRVSLWEGKTNTVLTTDSPYRTVVDIVGGNRKIPLKNGHFEISLPTKLFDENPREITVQWVDFFR